MGQTYVNVGDLKYQLDGTEAYVAGFATSEGVADIVIPGTIESDGLTFVVTKVNNNAFRSKSIVKSLTATSGNITYIGYYAFEGCSNLETVNILFSIGTAEIDYYAFNNCTGLKTADLTNIYEIDNNAFSNCSSLQKVNFGNRLRKLYLSRSGSSSSSSAPFLNCVNLTYVVLPASCTNKVGSSTYGPTFNSTSNYAFYGCNRLQAIIYLGDPSEQSSKCGSNAAVYNAKSWGTWSGSTFNYTGEAPEATLSYDGSVAGFQMTDYNLSALEKNAGTYTTTVPVTFTNNDMSFTVDKTFTYSVNKVPLTATVQSVARPYGDPNPKFTVDYDGFVGGEDESVLGEPTLSCTATQSSKVGTYPITLTGLKADNYTVTSTNGTLTVNKAPLEIYAGEYTREKGKANPTFSAKYSGWKNNETESVLTTKPKLSCTATEDSPVGQYDVLVTGAAATNYAISYRNGVLNVTDPVDTQNTLAITDMEVFTGKTVQMPILMNNVAEVTGLQFDLCLPSGISVAKNVKGKNLIELTDRMEDTYSLSSNTVADGVVRVTGLSIESAPFTGNEGAIINVSLYIDEELADGDYELQLKNIVLSDVNGVMHKPASSSATLTVKSFMLGDVDNSGDININDAVCIVNHILDKPLTTFIAPAADLDGSGDININDAVVLINRYILMKDGARATKAPAAAPSAEDNYLSIGTVNMKPGETKTVAVEMKNAEGIYGTQCNIRLPEGLQFGYTMKKDKKVYTVALNEDRMDDHTISSNLQDDGSLTVTTISLGGETYYDNEGTLFTFTVVAADDYVPGSHELTLGDVVLSCGEPIKPADRTSILNVIPDLDEDIALFAITSDMPEAAFTLKRSISAGFYNTVVLPFSLTDEQVKAAFGADAKVYAYQGDADGVAQFLSTTAGITANEPVLLTTSTAASSFNFSNVTLTASQPSATAADYAFTANYDGDIALPADTYFINSDKLYRSTGKSRLKGYRAYFSSSTDGARMTGMEIGGNATAIRLVDADEAGMRTYSIGGQQVSSSLKTLPKGVYIVNGKKVIK